MLRTGGVGVFGTLSGLVASWFLTPAAKQADPDLVEIKTVLADIQVRLGAERSQGSPLTNLGYRTNRRIAHGSASSVRRRSPCL